MNGTKSWFILTPDFDIYAEFFDLDGSQGPSCVRIKNKTCQYWSRFSQASYRFSEVVTDDAFKKYISEAIEEVRKAGHWDEKQVPSTMINRKGETVSTTAYLGRLLVKFRMSRQAAAGAVFDPALQGLANAAYDEDLQRQLKPVVSAPDGMIWISEECPAGKRLGEELDVRPGRGVMIGDNQAM